MTEVPFDASLLARRCRQLVATKYRIDDFMNVLRRSFGSEALDSAGVDWLQEIAPNPSIDDNTWLSSRYPKFENLEVENGLECYAIDPLSFVQAVLPVTTRVLYSSADLVLRDLDPSIVIGGNYAWHSETIDKSKLERLNAEVRELGPQWSEAAVYLQVGTLPLYIAIEGKNRARHFLKAHMNISAFVASIPFPEAKSLSLIKLRNSHTPFIYDPSTDDYVILVLPSIVVPLLTGYGVKWRWEFPPRTGLEPLWRESLTRLIERYMIA
jgi:hypothetical protein